MAFLAIFGPPWGLEFFKYCHIKLSSLIHPWTVGPVQKWSLFINFSNADWFFLANGHFGHFQCILGPFNRDKQPLGALQRPPEVINILRYACHNHKIPPPQKNSFILFLGHLNDPSRLNYSARRKVFRRGQKLSMLDRLKDFWLVDWLDWFACMDLNKLLYKMARTKLLWWWNETRI